MSEEKVVSEDEAVLTQIPDGFYIRAEGDRLLVVSEGRLTFWRPCALDDKS